MPVQALRLIRKMRGGAQAHLLDASDRHAYVVKFHNNPQHRRILVNEWIASTFLHYLGIAAPEVAIIELTQDFLDRSPEVYIQLGSQRRQVQPGWHFGSRYPGDPQRIVVYDFLPDTLLDRVENLADFRGVLAFDKWIGNADSRQAIFFRARVLDGLAGSGEKHLGFVAEMMDNGYVFEGPHWRFGESAIQGLYFRPLVYREVRGLADFEPWLDRIRHFPEEVVDQAIKRIPPAWLEGDEEALERLLEQLLRRRARVADLIENCRSGRVNPFPNWRG
jgi:hypothetical protein